MRTPIVAGNWKMNNNLQETKILLNALQSTLSHSDAEVIVSPSFTNLAMAVECLSQSFIEVAAQNMHFAESGAYTGEISAKMLLSLGVRIVILGHSERRAYFEETDKILTKKVNAALKNNMRIIFCFGEELTDRQAGKHFEVVVAQVKNTLYHLPADAWNQIILAYEPVWAIGTGETATAAQAQEVHAHIRQAISSKYNSELANQVRILYGGSVKPDNAREIFSQTDVDGGLIGGASLKADDFSMIVNSTT